MEGEWPDGGDDTRTLGRPARSNARQDAQEGRQAAPPAAAASVPTVDAASVLAVHARIDAGRFNGQPPEWVCVFCQEWWRGDAESGGCEERLLARRVIALEEFITRLLASHRGLEGLVCQEFGGDEDDSDALDAEWAALRAPRAGEGGGG